MVTWGLVAANILLLALFGIVLNRLVFKGERTAFIMEMPLYHLPNVHTISLWTFSVDHRHPSRWLRRKTNQRWSLSAEVVLPGTYRDHTLFLTLFLPFDKSAGECFYRKKSHGQDR